MADGKPKLCLITTGGTIGMVRDADGTARPPADALDLTTSHPTLHQRCDLDVVPLFNKDSTNLTPRDWSALAEAIHARWDAGYDGFVVAHGTDTMHFSAAAVALALGPLPLERPVVFTGAMRTADSEDPDGPRNLEDACRAAAFDFGEVVIALGGKIWRGCRAMKRRVEGYELDAYAADERDTLGGFMGGAIWTRMDYAFRPKPEEVASASPRELRATFAEGVLPITLSPGVEPRLFRAALESGDCRGVVLQTLGSGNVPDLAEGGAGSWVAFIRDATQRDVPVLLTSPLPGGATHGGSYAPGRAAVAAGGITTGNLTPACAIVKLRWAIAQAEAEGGPVVEATREIMQRVWVNEESTPS